MNSSTVAHNLQPISQSHSSRHSHSDRFSRVEASRAHSYLDRPPPLPRQHRDGLGEISRQLEDSLQQLLMSLQATSAAVLWGSRGSEIELNMD